MGDCRCLRMSAVYSPVDRIEHRARRADALTLALALTFGGAVAGYCAEVSDPAAASTVATATEATASSGQLPLQAPPPAPPCNEPLCYTASSLQAERNHLVLTDIEIVDTTRGTTQIKADRAEATGLGPGQQPLGAHRPRAGVSDAGAAAGQRRHGPIHRQAHRLDCRGRIAGAVPAPGRAHRSGRATDVTGHAQRITYDVARDEVQLTGNSWLTDGCNDISTQQITYDIASQRVEAAAAPGQNGRVHGTIGARSGAPCAPAAGSP